MILRSNGGEIELTLTSPYSYMLIGLIFFACAMGIALDGNKNNFKYCLTSLGIGIMFEIFAYSLFLFQTNNICGIIVILYYLVSGLILYLLILFYKKITDEFIVTYILIVMSIIVTYSVIKDVIKFYE